MDKRIKNGGGICPHSGRYRISSRIYTSPPGASGLLRAKRVAKIGQKRHEIASKCLVNGRKLIQRTKSTWNCIMLVTVCFPIELRRCKAEEWWKWKSLIGLGALKISEYLKTLMILGISVSKSNRIDPWRKNCDIKCKTGHPTVGT